MRDLCRVRNGANGVVRWCEPVRRIYENRLMKRMRVNVAVEE